MKQCNVYENKNMRNMLGETLRPGGFALTEKAMEFCKFTSEDMILDLGCGGGATIGYLNKNYGIKGVGVDLSEKLLNIARNNYPYGDFVMGKGEDLPFADGSFDGVLAECTLSLMEDFNITLKEVYRVLKKEGWFVISDVYARQPTFIKELKESSVKSCMRGLHDLNLLKESLERQGFKIMVSEDHSPLLKELMVKIIFSYGTMGVFWNKTTDNCIDGEKFQKILKSCKPGYFLIIGRKGGGIYE